MNSAILNIIEVSFFILIDLFSITKLNFLKLVFKLMCTSVIVVDFSRLKADMLWVASILLVCTPSCLSVSTILTLSLSGITLIQSQLYYLVLTEIRHTGDVSVSIWIKWTAALSRCCSRSSLLCRKIWCSQIYFFPPHSFPLTPPKVNISHPHWRNKITSTFVDYISSSADCFLSGLRQSFLMHWSTMQIPEAGQPSDCAKMLACYSYLNSIHSWLFKACPVRLQLIMIISYGEYIWDDVYYSSCY